MKVCPRCGSSNIDCVSLSDESLWICKTCEYTGPVIEGDEELIREIKENYNDKLKGAGKKEEINEKDKKNQPLDNVMKICPRCGSDNIDWIIPQNWSRWVCKTCNYIGPVIEGDEKMIKEIRENYIKKLMNQKEKINESDLEDESLEDDLTDEEIEKKLDELTETDFDLKNYEEITEKLISGVNSNIIEIYNNIIKKILSWNKKIKLKTMNNYLTFLYNNEFLKISLNKDKINFQLSFSEDNSFDDFKAITKEITSENEDDGTTKLSFSLNSYDDIEYALFLIKQSYANNSNNSFLERFIDKYY
ncbi:MAG: DUF5655 domain-containing protein [Methanobacteriaceae archaeon]|nr:DUF5655 domain-containing protein [Candidatus Methanorudis spinitermitis]